MQCNSSYMISTFDVPVILLRKNAHGAM